MYFENQLTELAVDEYAFLTENFELSSKADIQNGVGYILFNRKRNVINTVKKVIENELNDIEKNIIFDYFGNNLSADELVKKYKVSRATVYRHINNGKKKIEKLIKYVLLYETNVQEYSVADFFEFIKGESIES